jgi:hypothetical protein
LLANANPAKDSDKGYTYIWPTDQPVPPPYRNVSRNEIEEVIMWSSFEPERPPQSYENRPVVATIPTNLAAAEVMSAEISNLVSTMQRSKAICAVQPLVSTTCHVVGAYNLKDFGDWIDYAARNGSIIRLSTFAEVEQTHWSNLTLGYFDNAPPPLWKVAPDDPESLIGIFLQPHL